MRLIHHGAHRGVTGSCHQLKMQNGNSYLVDCGMFQGDDAKEHPNPEIKFPLKGIAALLLTHVHIDHCGRIPYLLSAGFDKSIYCSHPTAKLLPLVMEDAIRIGFTRNRRMIERFLKTVGKQLRPLDYHRWHAIEGGARIRLRPAGHVLGSTVFEVETPDGATAVFSGDIGSQNAPLLNAVTSPPKADLLVLESTYGDRLHDNAENRQQQLEDILRHTLKDKGVTIIPAFSLGRTQALLFEMNNIFERIEQQSGHSLMKAVDVIVDSPLASRFTEIYKDLQAYWGEEAQAVLRTDDQPLVFNNLTTVGDHSEHMDTLGYLAEHRLPAVVIAGSGMCTGGRVVNYLKRFLSDPTADVVFVGYQAHGTPGRTIQQQRDWVRLDGRKFDIQAKVHQLSGYSAHGDQADLIRFVEGFQSRPQHIRLVHGEYHAKKVLNEELSRRGYDVD
ncbi:MBL fold metallo-hydrolase RNA specificity domain-containing protein [Roseimaritima sediminicola]|uniref:MBL fold metallo-hydrolase RNA specificity domain-containing protein n=1 Tax=Roseimaritima sediminicola TaxID=2662066 RepID=UPI0012983165|nr:MBL fold metallo-hydrolase [Roseimaritima sediminicola]